VGGWVGGGPGARARATLSRLASPLTRPVAAVVVVVRVQAVGDGGAHGLVVDGAGGLTRRGTGGDGGGDGAATTAAATAPAAARGGGRPRPPPKPGTRGRGSLSRGRAGAPAPSRPGRAPPRARPQRLLPASSHLAPGHRPQEVVQEAILFRVPQAGAAGEQDERPRRALGLAAGGGRGRARHQGGDAAKGDAKHARW